MASVVGICNAALIKIGAGRIGALTEDSKNARLCDQRYADVRDKLLRVHTWNFAIRRAKLAREAPAPAFEFAYAYPLPVDWARTVKVTSDASGVNRIAYRQENNRVLTNATDIYLVYGAIIADPNAMDSLFRDALATALAAELAIPIADSQTRRDSMLRELAAIVPKSRSVDALDDPPEGRAEGNWVRDRF